MISVILYVFQGTGGKKKKDLLLERRIRVCGNIKYFLRWEILNILNAGRKSEIKCWKVRLKSVWSVGWSAENSDRILWVKCLHGGVPFQSKRDTFFIIMGENINYMCKTGMFYLGCRKLRKIHLMIRIVFIVTYHDSSDVVGWLF